MFINPMDSLPGYGAVLKNHFKLSAEEYDRTGGDLVAAVLDYLIGIAWENFGLWPKEAEKHRKGTSIFELQHFLDWAFNHLLEDMELTENKKEEMNKEYMDAILAFMRSGEEEEVNEP